MPIQMPSSPPYPPTAEPPAAPQWLPPPPAPPAQPPSHTPRPRRGRGAALVVALSLLCGGIGLELGSALFGASTPTRTAAPSSTVSSVPLPTVGSTAPATGGTTALTAEEIAAKVDPAIVDITTKLDGGSAAGTGMVLTSSGLVLTNNHVIADATEIHVQVNGSGPTYSAIVLGYDVTDDVALLQVEDAPALTAIDVGDSSTVAIDDHVVALGNALGRGGTPAVAEGDVTALARSIEAGDATGNGAPTQTLTGLIEFNAQLLPGDSGGPLVNDAGQVIGMDTAASQATRRRTASDSYAIPINTALEIAHQIQSGQSTAKVHVGPRALLGVQVQQSGGAAVAGVQSGGPAAKAGITAGDVITSVDGTAIDSVSDLPAALDRYRPGDRVTIGWTSADGQSHTASVELAEGPPA